jgi:metallophosphoesterase (TIGR00282 family)
MRLLFLGDVVGRPGRQAVIAKLPGLRERYKLDFVVVNGENSAGGFGITEAICADLIDAGADAVTLGNHAFDQKETLVFIERQPRLLRPLNYPPGTPGRGSGIFKAANGADVLVINAMGLVYMPELGDPFRAVEAEVAACGLKRGADAILVDFHAEATSEKQAMGYFLDGRVSLVAGTHTHAPAGDGSDRAAQPLPHQDSALPHGAGRGAGDDLGRGGRDRRLDRPCDQCGRAAARRRSDAQRATLLGRLSAFPLVMDECAAR